MVYDPQRDRPRRSDRTESSSVVDSLLDPVADDPTQDQRPGVNAPRSGSGDASRSARRSSPDSSRQRDGGASRGHRIRGLPLSVWAAAAAVATVTLAAARLLKKLQDRRRRD